MQYLIKEQIITAANKIFTGFTQACTAIDENIFFRKPAPGKWSVAEHVQHLCIATQTSTLAFTLPLFVVRLLGGKPNQDSRSYEKLVERYQEKLATGGKATGRFIPNVTAVKTSKTTLLDNWQMVSQKFIGALQQHRSESQLDDYLVRHPLLGRITLRELCYFTIYHTGHHLDIITSIAPPPRLPGG